MKSSRWMLTVVLVVLSAAAFAQSDAQKSFETMKSLAGLLQNRSAAAAALGESGGGGTVTDTIAALLADPPSPLQVTE